MAERRNGAEGTGQHRGMRGREEAEGTEQHRGMREREEAEGTEQHHVMHGRDEAEGTEQHRGMREREREGGVAAGGGGLREAELFRHLDAAALDSLAGRFAETAYAAGETIIREGEEGDTFYVLARGEVEVTATDASGAVKRMATLGPGDHFGELALLAGVMRTANVVALTPCVLLSLARDRFEALLAEAPELRERLLHMAERRRQAADGADNGGTQNGT